MSKTTNKATSFKDKFNAFSKTFVGKLTLSATRAFIGVFIAAESQLFDAAVKLVGSHSSADFGVLKSLVAALAAAGVTAAVRAVQHYFFERNTTPPAPTRKPRKPRTKKPPVVPATPATG